MKKTNASDFTKIYKENPELLTRKNKRVIGYLYEWDVEQEQKIFSFHMKEKDDINIFFDDENKLNKIYEYLKID
jgi:hypothetical protein